DGERSVLLFDGYPIHDLRPGEPIVDEEPFVCFDENVVTIEGVWDLAMLGGDRIDVESDLHRLIGGPEVSMVNLDGTFLNREDGVWALLQERLEDRIEVD
ncbi:MAG: hypothetical protein NWS01_00025, partial [Burkholderiales bacterium]|nr:hypothetical protein [Burkholderiales bacterium]